MEDLGVVAGLLERGGRGLVPGGRPGPLGYTPTDAVGVAFACPQKNSAQK